MAQPRDPNAGQNNTVGDGGRRGGKQGGIGGWIGQLMVDLVSQPRLPQRPHHPSMPSFEFDIPDPSDMFRQLEQQRQAQQQEAERRAARKEIDNLLSARTEAEKAAIKEVDSSLTQQMDRSRLLGLDFQVPDEDRLLRISNMFSELYPEEQDSRLNKLMGQYGAPNMSEAERLAIEAGDLRFTPEFVIQRGAGRDSAAAGDEGVASGGRAVGGRKGRRQGLLDEDEEQQPNVLGV